MGKSNYLIAFVATVAIFAVVLFSVKAYEDSRFQQLNNDLWQMMLENELDKVYSESQDINSSGYCDFAKEGIANTIQKLYTLDLRLKSYKETMISSDYVSVKKNYLLTNLLLFQRVMSISEKCDLNINSVIYFYAEDNSCDVECGIIANQLEQIKSECEPVRVFAFPYNSPDYKFTSILEKKFDVNKPATLIIHGVKIDSIQTKDFLLRELGCS